VPPGHTALAIAPNVLTLGPEAAPTSLTDFRPARKVLAAIRVEHGHCKKETKHCTLCAEFQFGDEVYDIH
jgi:hypothetical protein